MAKGTFSEMKTFNKGKFFKKIVIAILIVAAVTIAFFIIGKVNAKPEAPAEAPNVVTTKMVPTTIKYYDPGQEKTFDTGADYIILTDGNQKIKVDSSGNVSYVTDDGQVIGELSGETRSQWINQAVSIMQSDSQAALALSGLEKAATQESTEPAQPQTAEEYLRSILQNMGIGYEDFVGKVYQLGSTLGDVYTLLYMYDDDQAVIKSIMDAKIEAEEPEQTQKAISVSVETLGGNTSPSTSYVDNSKTSESDYPAWMQSSDPSASMSALVNSLSSLASTGTGSTDATWEKVNQTAEKMSWLDSQQATEAGKQAKLTKWDLAWGSVIPITLVTGLNTDLPGNVIGLVRQDIYDTLTGTNVLIPKGSRVLASYNSSISFGQKSVQIAWTQLITPDGTTYSLPGFQGVSQEGYAGVAGKVNNHFWQILGGAVLGSIINYSAETVGGLADNAASSLGNDIISGYATALTGSTLDTTAGYATKYTNMWMNLQPTIKIKTGAQIQMLVNQTMNFKK